MCAVLRFAFPQATSYAIPLSTITVFTLLCGAATSTKNALVKQKMHQPRAILVAASLYFFGWIPRQSFTYIVYLFIASVGVSCGVLRGVSVKNYIFQWCTCSVRQPLETSSNTTIANTYTHTHPLRNKRRRVVFDCCCSNFSLAKNMTKDDKAALYVPLARQ